ncbi:hypothetical protein SOM26_03765 [Sphingomonas sp. CFBP8993]|nr:hypothetical protein [Sphingomonas sp. CFBP8993]MDY0957797.1 hypothetical protein [Sphingomonas sp. CFBP8993]
MTALQAMPTVDAPSWFGSARASDARHVADAAAIVGFVASSMR